VAHFTLDPGAALQLVQILLRGVAYLFAGFAVLGLLTYVAFLCLEVFASRPKPRTAKVAQPISSPSVVEQTHNPGPSETLPLSGEARVAEAPCKQRTRIDFPDADTRARVDRG
jgi:hypothetical protein